MKKLFFLVMITIIIGAIFISCDPDAGGAIYKAGTYTATATGFKDGLKVAVTFDSTAITKIEVVDHNESDERSAIVSAINDLPSTIVNAQSTNVDTVSGATATSNGIKKAVDDAIAQAKGENLGPPFKDGTFTAAGEGYGGPITLSVTFLDNRMTKIDIIDHSETGHHIIRVIPVVPPAILEAQSTEVDVVTSSSRSSNGIKDAVKAAIRKSKADL